MENTTTRTSIVARVKALLKLGDDGKIDSFFNRESKKLKRDIESLRRNLETCKLNHVREIEGLEEQLEDAKAELDNAYLDVRPEEITTNAAQEEFSTKYWDKITECEESVSFIEDTIKNNNKLHKETTDYIEEQIKETSYRLEKIS